MMATLEQFLRHGELGPFRVGMDGAELVEVLGPPDGSSGTKNVRILMYGALQVTLTRGADRDERVSAAGLYYQPSEQELPESVRPEDWLPGANTTEAAFRVFLEKIGLEPISTITDGDSRTLVFDTGSRVTFTSDRLIVLQYLLRGNRRSVAITLPEEAFLRLRELARGENRTLSEMCAEMLVERAANLQPG
jgi:hypothetical protein